MVLRIGVYNVHFYWQDNLAHYYLILSQKVACVV